jgi:hypothetical protein
VTDSAPPPPLPDDMSRAITVRRGDDVAPSLASPWREVRIGFVVPESSTGAAHDVRALLPEPELHWAPGLRRGTLAVLPQPAALTRVLLSWEWSVAAADFTVHSFDDEPFTRDERTALEAWLRGAATRLQLLDGAVEAAVDRAVIDVASGVDESAPPVGAPAGPIAWAVLGTRVAVPDHASAHARVDVALPDGDDPGWEVFMDAATGERLGYRRTLDAAGEPYAFSYLVADHVDDVSPDDLRHWHDQHIHRQLLADDVRQAYVHLLAGLDAPVSVTYSG